MDNPEPEKVAVVDEVRERLDGAERRPAHRVPRPERRRRSPSCAARCGRPAASTRSTRTPSSASPPATSASTIEDLLIGPTAIAFVDSDAVERGQGAPRLRPDQPGPRRQGRPARRQGARRPPRPRPSPTSAPRGAAGPARRCHGGADAVQFAGLLQALPRNFAYGLQALIDKQGGVPERGRARSRRAEPEAADAEARAEAARSRRTRGRGTRPESRGTRPEPSETAAETEPATENPRRSSDHGHQGRDPRRHRQHDACSS